MTLLQQPFLVRLLDGRTYACAAPDEREANPA